MNNLRTLIFLTPENIKKKHDRKIYEMGLYRLFEN
jgi:hypothetical protein